MKNIYDQCFLICLLIILLFGDGTNAQALSSGYYLKKCPNAEEIIHRKMRQWFSNDTTLAPSIIRLHFHDCSVRGCDASVLLKYKGSERSAAVSKSLRGFDVINNIKSELEKQCPRTVSCADILTAAARDATVLLGGPLWELQFGRKDGRISIAKEADNLVPRGRENITELINLFETKLGLNVLDLVTLSGSHTIGRSTCESYKYSRSIKTSNGHPNSAPINAAYSNRLQSVCGKRKKQKKKVEIYVDLDVSTPRLFDTRYYSNLGNNMGLLTTDQALHQDPRTFPFVSVLAGQPELFFSQFSASMVKLSNVVSTGAPTDTEVRLHCDYVNSY